MADKKGTSSWSDIPLDLAGRILRRLPAYVDRVRFAAVCPQWRAATRRGPLPPPLPLLLLPDATVYSLPGSKPFHLPAGCTGYTDACGSWLVFPDEENGCFLLRDPLSNATMTLPPLSRVRTRLVSNNNGAVWSQGPSTEEPKSCKLWLCSSNLTVATINSMGRQWLAVCQAGASSWWSICRQDPGCRFKDVALHQGKLYAIDFMTVLFGIDVSVDDSGDPWISQIREVIRSPCLDLSYIIGDVQLPRAYLVESRGMLLVVLRLLHGPLDDPDALDAGDGNDDEFELFEANLSQSRWHKVTAIRNDEALFLRRRCSRSVSVPRDNALPAGGCIFFLLENGWDSSLYGLPRSCRVYSMTDGKASNPLPTVSWQPAGRMSATWLFPQN